MVRTLTSFRALSPRRRWARSVTPTGGSLAARASAIRTLRWRNRPPLPNAPPCNFALEFFNIFNHTQFNNPNRKFLGQQFRSGDQRSRSAHRPDKLEVCVLDENKAPAPLPAASVRSCEKAARRRKRVRHLIVNPCASMWGRRFRLPTRARADFFTASKRPVIGPKVGARRDTFFMHRGAAPRERRCSSPDSW